MSKYFTQHTSRRSVGYWSGPAQWVNTALLVIAGFIALDTLLRLLDANEGNALVGLVRSVAAVFLAPFQNMFADQRYVITAAIAILGWALLAALILAVMRAFSRGPVEGVTEERREVVEERVAGDDLGADERTRRL